MKKLIASAVVVAGLSFAGCQSREAKTEKQAPASQEQQQTQPGTGGAATQGTDQEPKAEEVNPHAMGGTGPTENVPPKNETVGEGSDSKFQQPKLEDERPTEEEPSTQQNAPADNR